MTDTNNLNNYEPLELENYNSKTKKSENFIALYRNPSGAVAKVFYECIDKMPKNEATAKMKFGLIISKYFNNEITDKNAMFMNALQKAIANNELSKEEIDEFFDTVNQKINIEEKNLLNDLYITMFKAMIDTRQMTSEQERLIKTDNDSDFWMNQNLMKIKNEVNRFRTYIE